MPRPPVRAIAAEPVTTEKQATTPINYDAACLEEVCGSCTVVINGRARQACSALVDHIRAVDGDGPITLEPMSKFPVVRDLIESLRHRCITRPGATSRSDNQNEFGILEVHSIPLLLRRVIVHDGRKYPRP